MTGYSTTYRHQGFSRPQARSIVAHDLRAHYVQHSNEAINPALSHLNPVLLFDGSQFRPPYDDEDPTASVMDRLNTVIKNSRPNLKKHQKRAKDPDTGKVIGTGQYEYRPVALRKDATVMTSFVLQLDSEFTNTGIQLDDNGEPIWQLDDNDEPIRDDKGYRVPVVRTCQDMTEDERTEAVRLLNVMANQMLEDFPDVQWLYVTVHLDETHPHIQASMVPTTDDGRINSKEVLGAGNYGKGGLRIAREKYAKRHDDMRQTLRDAGYDATFERVDGAKKHVGLRDYKQMRQDDLRRASELADEREEVEWERRLNDQTSKALNEKGQRLEEKRVKLDEQGVKLEEDFAARQLRLVREYGMRMEGLDERERELNEREEKFNAEARAFVRRVEEAERVRVEAAATFRAATENLPARVAEYLEQPVSPGSDRTHAQVIRTNELLSEAGRRYESTGVGFSEMTRPAPIPQPPATSYDGPEF